MLKHYSFRRPIKYATITETPKLLYKTFTLFFTKYNNDRKEHNFRRKKSQKKVIFTKTKKYLREMTLIMKKN